MGKHELFIGDSRNMDKVRTKSVSQGTSSLGDKEMESTCEFKLGNHRGYEDRYKYEVSMAMGALGIRKSEDKLTDEEWTLINDWIAGFHVRDVVSGPHADETGREKERIAKELKDKYGWDF